MDLTLISVFSIIITVTPTTLVLGLLRASYPCKGVPLFLSTTPRIANSTLILFSHDMPLQIPTSTLYISDIESVAAETRFIPGFCYIGMFLVLALWIIRSSAAKT
jgi:hypothetical protein